VNSTALKRISQACTKRILRQFVTTEKEKQGGPDRTGETTKFLSQKKAEKSKEELEAGISSSSFFLCV